MSRQSHYVLDDDNSPVETGELLKWARWMEEASRTGRRVVAQTTTKFSWVSTVFLGLDHSFGRKGPPILFETMGFTREKYMRELLGTQREIREETGDFMRYATWAEAEDGHRRIVEEILEREAEAEFATWESLEKLGKP